MSPLEVDAVLDVALSDDFDNDRLRARHDAGRNDNDTIYPEEMTDEQRQSLRLDELRVSSLEVLRLANFISLARQVSAGGGTLAPALYDAEICRARAVLGMLDRCIELEGE